MMIWISKISGVYVFRLHLVTFSYKIFKKKQFSQLTSNLWIWIRYVHENDTLVIWENDFDVLNSFLNDINKVKPIQFTLDVQHND